MAALTPAEAKCHFKPYFKKRVNHRILSSVYTQLSGITSQQNEDVEELYLLVGPSGGGKSTLLRRIEADILAEYAEMMEKDPSMIPAIYSQLTAPQDGNFNWKDFFSRLLEKFNDVLIRKKVILYPQAILDGEVIANIRALVREELRRAVRNAFAERKTKFLLLDEAGHLLLTKAAIAPRVQYELIKSVAQELKIPIILAGDYGLLGILDLNGQLTRRTEVIHLPRYQIEELADPDNLNGQSFRDVVYTLLESMSIAMDEGLIDHMDYFYQYSLGNIGLLKKWFNRALWRALLSEERRLTRKILHETRWSNKALKRMLTDIKFGEAQLADIKDEEIAVELGLDITPSIFEVTGNFSSGTSKTNQKKRPSAGGARAGARGPSRDPVGGIPHAT